MKDHSSIDYFMIEDMQIVPEWTYFNLNNETHLDLRVDMKGLEQYMFVECCEAAAIAIIKDIPVPFLHINHLPANKKAVNRLKDQLDVEQLEKSKSLYRKKINPKISYKSPRSYLYIFPLPPCASGSSSASSHP